MNDFCRGLTEEKFHHFRTEQRFGRTVLHEQGFWNALGRVLSPGALAKVRDTGTFYHLLPENPSASEWSIFWLRLLHPDANLYTIKAGIKTIIERLRQKLLPYEEVREGDAKPRLQIHLNSIAKGVESAANGRVLLSVSGRTQVQVDDLILAIPAVPLRDLSIQFSSETREYVNGVIPFPLTKIFAVIERPWWKNLPNPQHGAHLVPTREVHYFPCDNAKDNRCMVMFYTDRPGTAYWRPYIDYPHQALQINTPDTLKAELAEQIAKLLPNVGITEQAHRKRVYESIVKWAIRDWSEDPFGAACHAWLPGTDVPAALSHLKAFSLNGSTDDNIHICGEAYSDYQGFIEGALRSAEAVIATI